MLNCKEEHLGTARITEIKKIFPSNPGCNFLLEIFRYKSKQDGRLRRAFYPPSNSGILEEMFFNIEVERSYMYDADLFFQTYKTAVDTSASLSSMLCAV